MKAHSPPKRGAAELLGPTTPTHRRPSRKISNTSELDHLCTPTMPQSSTEPAEADPHLADDVNCLILDYLACLAISKTLSTAERDYDADTAEDVDWAVRPLKALESMIPKNALPIDLSIKLRVLQVANAIQSHRPQSGKEPQSSPSLARIGVDFMDLCLAAVSKISETRWLETGALFVLQVTIEEQSEEIASSQDLIDLRSWSGNDSTWNERWTQTWRAYLNELPQSTEHNDNAKEALQRQFSFRQFKAVVLKFLLDLMTTLEPPILIQLERGKLGTLSHAETQNFLDRVGLC
ncbi:hypothetical protein N7532_001274 [Penicillium argentinense]|uniref:Uncharacterized protein n=1 Tax=Penicillium argentinense TaxID=1131581 RepID=A0A9W9G255_9EURO|nr:uncharacterized protein N7532_001274 [Penicillium argentinense]KAJ5110739.1 hypothetical protein N7532_001274 [Penicillium argentinense]